MDTVRLLTRKFRAQDLTDRSQSALLSLLQMKEEALDSGTGSDEELARISPASTDIEDSNEEGEKEDEEEGHCGGQEEIAEASDGMRSNSAASEWSWKQLSGSANTDGCASSLGSFSSLSQIHRVDRSPRVEDILDCDCQRSGSSSDFERFSLDFETSSSSESETNSVDEELTTITREDKRKRSESTIFSDDDDDDAEVHKLFRGQSQFLFQSLSACSAEPFGASQVPRNVQAASPWKRHRRECVGTAVTHRPSLNFYKMQRTCIVRRHRTIRRPQQVKLWVTSGPRRPSKLTFDPAPFCFRSLWWASTADSD